MTVLGFPLWSSSRSPAGVQNGALTRGPWDPETEAGFGQDAELL